MIALEFKKMSFSGEYKAHNVDFSTAFVCFWLFDDYKSRGSKTQKPPPIFPNNKSK